MIRNQDETTVSQSKRLVKAGCGIVKTTMVGHEIVFHPVPLGKLWDVVSGYWPDVWEFSSDMRSAELIEALVRIIERHSEGCGKAQ
jgi:hypothetical protein